MASQTPKFHLHTYFRSSCSGRLRIALALKQISYTTTATNLLKDEQLNTAHLAINPSASVPILTRLDTDTSFPIGQSIAALEYLEEALPGVHPLLPAPERVLERVQVRTLVNIVACDIQPITNRRIILAVQQLGKDPAEWCRHFIERGFAAYEATLDKTAGRFSVGNEITLADVCLVPAVWGGERFGVDLEKFSRLKAVFEEMSRTEAVQKAHWKRQEDTPEEFREP
ncbi:maleylacetoacetate isomerase [Glonium stellatum]|uniref:Maleylacetoacetate isomerase n=1 Tax=Glonium stellatum TaxID=574774 RepID=A0A8E2F2C9_9PEZI|nr:maleylacetoacetate isomerase [Glonium stellatum]